MKDWDERLHYNGKQYKTIDGLVDAIAVENGIDERELDDVKKEILDRCDGTTFVVDVEDLADAILEYMRSAGAPEV